MRTERPKLVILGSGFASFSLLKNIDVDRYEIVVVSPRNHFLFTPLLPSTTVGTIEFRSIIEPVRTARKDIRFHQARCVGIDLEKREVDCRGFYKETPFTLDYDALVIGVGAVSNTFGVPGVLEHAMLLKELADARAIRQRIGECFERASKPDRDSREVESLLRFVVVGGGPTGVEFAAELHDFVRQDLAKWYPDLIPYVSIVILEAADAILNSFDQALSRYAHKHFGRSGIAVRTQSAVKEVRDESVILNSGEELRCGLVVWSTGIGPTPFVQALPFRRDEESKVLTDQTFQVLGHEGVYAIGDCASIDGQPLPPTAQVAQQAGTYLAKHLNRIVRGKEAQPFEYRHMGMMAYIGGQKALADLNRVKSRGRWTWLFWRSAYLTKLVSFKNKLLVLGDWIQTWVFGRDISRF